MHGTRFQPPWYDQLRVLIDNEEDKAVMREAINEGDDECVREAMN